MSKYLDENGLLYLWEKITDAIDPKADKVPEVNHGTSDTTFTLTPNIMHIWGEIATLNLTLSADSNSVLDEYMFTFTCPSDAATNLTLPSPIKWILQPELLAGKTYLVSIVNGLAGYLTDDMPATGLDNIIETIKVNGTALTPDANKAVDITVPQGTVTSVIVNGSNYTPDANGLVNLGTISGESGSGGEYNVIEGVTFNGTTAPITNKIAAITYTAPTLSKGTTTGSGNAVTDISVSGHTITITKGSTFLTSHQDISGKANDTDVVHKTGNETITGNKTFQGLIYVNTSDNYIEDSGGYLVINSDTGVQVTGNGFETFGCGIYSDGQIEAPTIKCTDTGNRASNKFFATDGTIQTLPTGSGGEANVIESVKVNGTALTVTNKAVDITSVPASIVTQDATHRFATDTEKSTWSGKANDNAVVHLTGTETITGSKTFQFGTTTTFEGNIEIGQSYIRGTQSQGEFGFIVSDDQGTDRSLQDALNSKQATLVSGTNIKTINGTSILGSGNIALTTIYSGSSTPASSLGNNGDIYIKVT